MHKLSIPICSTLLFAILAPQSLASTISYEIRGRVAGSSANDTFLGSFEFDISKSDLVQEVLPSGTTHNRYNFALFDPGLPLSTNYNYRIYNQRSFLTPFGQQQDFSIDQFLNPDGSSSLSIEGFAIPGCHGGCLIEQQFSLNFASARSDLSADLAHPLSFTGLSSATGSSTFEFTNFVPVSETTTTVTDFTITSVSVVPEMDTWVFMLGGLGLAACYLRRKASGNTDVAFT